MKGLDISKQSWGKIQQLGDHRHKQITKQSPELLFCFGIGSKYVKLTDEFWSTELLENWRLSGPHNYKTNVKKIIVSQIFAYVFDRF